jgi:CRP-like cAMP-binding protein
MNSNENVSQPFVPDLPDQTEGWQQLDVGLPGLGILSMMTPQSLATLSQYGTYAPYKAGDVIFSEGDMQDKFYVVVDGLVEVYVTVDGQKFVLAQADAGECLGESTLLEPAPAVNSVIVLQDAMLWSMDAMALRTYLSKHVGGGGALLMGMAQCLSQRLRNANQQIMEHCNKPTFKAPSAVKAIHAPAEKKSSGLFSGLFGGSDSEKLAKIRTDIRL